MVKLIASLAKSRGADGRIMRVADGRQPVGEQGGVETRHAEGTDDAVQGPAVGGGLLPGGLQGLVGGRGLGEGGTLAAEEVDLVVGGGLEPAGVGG